MDTLTLRKEAVDIINELSDDKIQEVVMFARFVSNYKQDAENQKIDSYSSAIEKWRKDSEELFKNESDRDFMQHAFDSIRSKEQYKAKKIW